MKIARVVVALAVSVLAVFAVAGTAAADPPGMTHNGPTPGMTHN